MTGKCLRLVCWTVCLVAVVGGHLQPANAMDTANVLLGIDGMTLRAGGIFRDPGSFDAANGNDGFNTFQFGTFEVQNAITTGHGKYDAFRFRKTGTGDCCISHNARINSNTPEDVIDSTATPPAVSNIVDSITSGYLPIIDRAVFGQVFNPAEYQIEVKFKPLLTQATANSLGTNPFPSNPTYPNITAALENTAPLFTVALDQHGGYVWDEEAGSYKRAAEQIFYNIGSEATPVNTWYASAPHDANGYATWTVPLTSPSNVAKSFYFSFGSGDFRDNYVVANGGRVFNEDTQAYEDATIGYGENFSSFGGGPSDPGNPNSKLNVPNGVALMALGAPNAQLGLSLEIKSIALKKIAPSPIMARIDANSGISFRFGSGFTYGDLQPPINTPGGSYNPIATDQISRFDANGMTNLILNMRTPNDANEVHRFLIRGPAMPSTFDATDAVVNIRGKLLQAITSGIADTLRIYARGRKGNDTGAGLGADEWYYDLDLTQFNTSTMTTISIPMAAFTRNLMASALGPPLGFANFGDGLLTNFGLYEFGGLVAANSGLLKLELEFMEIRLAAAGLAGDYNGDGFVDAADYTVWRNNLGGSDSAFAAGSRDPMNAGLIDNDDYTFWKNNYGNSAGSGGLAVNAAVPEPATWSLFGISLMALFMKRRGR